MKKICENCFYWKNNQREIHYSQNVGFCGHDPYTDDGELLIGCFPHDSWDKIPHELLNNEGLLKSHFSEIVTHKTYCCNHWEDLKQCQQQEIV